MRCSACGKQTTGRYIHLTFEECDPHNLTLITDHRLYCEDCYEVITECMNRCLKSIKEMKE